MYYQSNEALEMAIETRAVEERLGLHRPYRAVTHRDPKRTVPTFFINLWQSVLMLF